MSSNEQPATTTTTAAPAPPPATNGWRDFGAFRETPQIHLCIPSIERTITAEFVASKIAGLGLGTISRVNFSANRDSEFKKAIIYFDTWNKDEGTAAVLKRLNETGCLSVIYDFPKVWKCRILSNECPRSGSKSDSERTTSSTTSYRSSETREGAWGSSATGAQRRTYNPPARRVYVPAPSPAPATALPHPTNQPPARRQSSVVRRFK